MLIRLRNWLIDTGKYDDVLAMLPVFEIAPRRREPKAAAKDGFVYLLRLGDVIKLARAMKLSVVLRKFGSHCRRPQALNTPSLLLIYRGSRHIGISELLTDA